MLRVARFAARYHHLGFAIAPETMALMGEIVLADELAYLSTERIWVETEKALTEQDPQVYWQTLKACGALAVVMPELQVSQGIEALARSAAFTGRARIIDGQRYSPTSPKPAPSARVSASRRPRLLPC